MARASLGSAGVMKEGGLWLEGRVTQLWVCEDRLPDFTPHV